MPDLAELDETTGFQHRWSVDQVHGRNGYEPGSLEVALERRGRFGWRRLASMSRSRERCARGRNHLRIVNNGLRDVADNEITASLAVLLASEILSSDILFPGRTDVNGLTGAVFSDRIKHG